MGSGAAPGERCSHHHLVEGPVIRIAGWGTVRPPLWHPPVVLSGDPVVERLGSLVSAAVTPDPLLGAGVDDDPAGMRFATSPGCWVDVAPTLQRLDRLPSHHPVCSLLAGRSEDVSFDGGVDDHRSHHVDQIPPVAPPKANPDDTASIGEGAVDDHPRHALDIAFLGEHCPDHAECHLGLVDETLFEASYIDAGRVGAAASIVLGDSVDELSEQPVGDGRRKGRADVGGTHAVGEHPSRGPRMVVDQGDRQAMTQRPPGARRGEGGSHTGRTDPDDSYVEAAFDR